jgi:hypothetical protein
VLYAFGGAHENSKAAARPDVGSFRRGGETAWRSLPMLQVLRFRPCVENKFARRVKKACDNQFLCA